MKHIRHTAPSHTDHFCPQGGRCRVVMVFMNMLVSVSCLGFQVFMAFIIPLPPNSILVDPIHCMLSKFSQALRLVKLTSIHESIVLNASQLF